MVGSIVGAQHGVDALPDNYLSVLNEANNFDLDELATRIVQLHDLDDSANSFVPKSIVS